MRTKKMMVGIFLVFSIVAVFVTNAFAVETTFTCTINRIGIFGATPSAPMYVFLNTPVNPNLQCRISEARLNQTLAVLLTAASNGATLSVRVDPDLPAIERILKFVYYNVD